VGNIDPLSSAVNTVNTFIRYLFKEDRIVSRTFECAVPSDDVPRLYRIAFGVIFSNSSRMALIKPKQ